jgi:hypothetical protein
MGWAERTEERDVGCQCEAYEVFREIFGAEDHVEG